MKKLYSKITLFFILLSPVIVYLAIIKENGVGNFLPVLATLDRLWLMLGVACMLFYWFIESITLKMTARYFHRKLPFKTAVKTTMIGQFFNAVTPFATGGQPMQMYYLLQSQSLGAGTASSVLVVKFIVYQTVLTLYSAIILIFKFSYLASTTPHMTLFVVLGFSLNASTIIMLILFTKNKRFAQKIVHQIIRFLNRIKLIKKPEDIEKMTIREITKFHKGYLLIKGNYKMWVITGSLCALQLTCFYTITYCIQRSFGFFAAWRDIVMTQATVMMITSFVPLPGAAGAAEGSFIVFLGRFFTPPTIGPAVLIWRFITYYACLIVGSVTMFISQFSDGK